MRGYRGNELLMVYFGVDKMKVIIPKYILN